MPDENLPLCACGCGERVSHRPGRTKNTYRHGHWSRTAENRAMQAAKRATTPPPNPSGLCMCGCGQTTPISSRTKRAHGIAVGEHVKFIAGHQNHLRRADKSPQWKDGRRPSHDGYMRVYMPDHPSAVQGYVAEHRLVVELDTGQPIPPGFSVHHLNGVRDDNRRENLIVLSGGDHGRLHAWIRSQGISI